MDFVCQVYGSELDRVTGVLINGREVPLNQELKNNDRVEIRTDGKIKQENWENYAITAKAKQKIKQYNERSKKNKEN